MHFAYGCLRSGLIALVLSSALASQTQPVATEQSGAMSTPPASSAGSDFKSVYRLSQQGKYDEAIASLQSMSTRTPKPQGLSHAIGTVYYKKGDYLKAADYFKLAIAEDAS